MTNPVDTFPVVTFGLVHERNLPSQSQLVFVLITPGDVIPVKKALYLKYEKGVSDLNFSTYAKRIGGEDLISTLDKLAPHIGNGELLLKSAVVIISLKSDHPWCRLEAEEEIMSATAEIRMVLAEIFPPRTQFNFEPNARGLAMAGHMLSA